MAEILPKWVTEADLAYIAGFLDADGCFCISRSATNTFHRLTFSPRVSGFSIDKHVLDYVQSVFGGSIISQKNKNYKAWRWTVNSDNACEVAKALYPYLRIKKNQAEIIIRYYSESMWLRKGGRYVGGSAIRMPQDEFDRRVNLSMKINGLNKRDYLQKNPQ